MEGTTGRRMNDLIRISEIPGYGKLLEELEQRVFGDVATWEEFSLRFLRGEGLSPVTYRNWKSGCKQFFEEFLGMQKSPFRITIQDVEAFFDHIYETRSPQTAGLRIAQLRAFLKNSAPHIPSPKIPFIDWMRNWLGSSESHRRTRRTRDICGRRSLKSFSNT
jgi:hypothetical protein